MKYGRFVCLPLSAAALAAVSSTHASAQWSIETLPTPRSLSCGAALDGRVYIAGGQDATGAHSDVVDVFDEATSTWSALTLPEPLWFGEGVAAGDSVFFGMGVESFGPLDLPGEIYEYPVEASDVAFGCL